MSIRLKAVDPGKAFLIFLPDSQFCSCPCYQARLIYGGVLSLSHSHFWAPWCIAISPDHKNMQNTAPPQSWWHPFSMNFGKGRKMHMYYDVFTSLPWSSRLLKNPNRLVWVFCGGVHRMAKWNDGNMASWQP